MLRVLLTADPMLPVPPSHYGGIERIVDGLARELRMRGHSVGLVAHPESACAVDFFRPWTGTNPDGRSHTLANMRVLALAVEAFRPDVVHSFSRLMFLLPLMRQKRAMLMSYQRQTGGWRNRAAALLGGKSFAFSACSEFIAAQGRRQGGRWTAIHNFVDVDYFRFSPAVDPDAPLVFLSRLEAIKGAHTAIRIALAAGRRLVIAGNRVDSPDGRAYWSNEIEPHLRSGQISYVGEVDEAQKNDLLGRAAALLVPIEWEEPFGIVFAEALACGTPVISCPRGALPEIVRHGEHGFLVSSIAEGVAAVGRLTGIDRFACRRLAEQRFSRRVACDGYLAVYRELATHASPRVRP